MWIKNVARLLPDVLKTPKQTLTGSNTLACTSMEHIEKFALPQLAKNFLALCASEVCY